LLSLSAAGLVGLVALMLVVAGHSRTARRMLSQVGIHVPSTTSSRASETTVTRALPNAPGAPSSIGTTQRPPALTGAGTEDPYAWGAWRGTPLQVWETWNNFKTWAEMTGVPMVHTYFTGEGAAPYDKRFPGKMSFAQPMWALGEDANTCASGANDANMQKVFINLRAAWGGDAYVRLGWEMDGYWFPQNYAPSDPSAWVKCWRRWHAIIKGVSPGFKLVWNPNFESNTDGHGVFDVRTVWPGDEYVDIAGPDYYDWDIDPDETDTGGRPRGINTWLAFVASHHKPFASPEWGLNAPKGSGDNPVFIQQMHAAFQRAKNSPTGLEYESYFNLSGCDFQLNTGGCNPNSSALYRQLW
jgi:hypothetical protein